MTRPIRTVVVHQPNRTPAPPTRQNTGWGKLVGALVLGIGGGLGYKIPGLITGAVVGLGLGHWLDGLSAESGTPANASGGPRSADDIAAEANAALALEVRDAFLALEQAAGIHRSQAARDSLRAYLGRYLGISDVPQRGAAIPWQQDLASACAGLAKELDPKQRRALVVALYQHARSLELGAGPARLLLRDGAAALGVSPDEEDRLRAEAGML